MPRALVSANRHLILFYVVLIEKQHAVTHQLDKLYPTLDKTCCKMEFYLTVDSRDHRMHTFEQDFRISSHGLISY